MSYANLPYSINSPSEGYLTRYLGPQFRILQLNAEELSNEKSSYLEQLLEEHRIDKVMLQETHIPDEQQMLCKMSIIGITLVSAI